MDSPLPDRVAIVMGSQSDSDTMAKCGQMLEHFEIGYREFVMSAHRNPKETREFAESAESRGFRIIIAAAGMAAHLPGVIAAHTTLPVIGVPMPGSHLNGLDALYAIVQMPSGVPVATVAIGSAGAANAAVLAAQILSLQDPELKARLREFKTAGSRITS